MARILGMSSAKSPLPIEIGAADEVGVAITGEWRSGLKRAVAATRKDSDRSVDLIYP